MRSSEGADLISNMKAETNALPLLVSKIPVWPKASPFQLHSCPFSNLPSLELFFGTDNAVAVFLPYIRYQCPCFLLALLSQKDTQQSDGFGQFRRHSLKL